MPLLIAQHTAKGVTAFLEEFPSYCQVANGELILDLGHYRTESQREMAVHDRGREGVAKEKDTY